DRSAVARRRRCPERGGRGSVGERRQRVLPPVPLQVYRLGGDGRGSEEQAAVGERGGTILLATEQIEQIVIGRRGRVERNQQIESRDQSIRVVSEGGKLADQFQVKRPTDFDFVKYQRGKLRKESACSLDDVDLFSLRIDLDEVDVFPTIPLHAIVESDHAHRLACACR